MLPQAPWISHHRTAPVNNMVKMPAKRMKKNLYQAAHKLHVHIIIFPETFTECTTRNGAHNMSLPWQQSAVKIKVTSAHTEAHTYWKKKTVLRPSDARTLLSIFLQEDLTHQTFC